MGGIIEVFGPKLEAMLSMLAMIESDLAQVKANAVVAGAGRAPARSRTATAASGGGASKSSEIDTSKIKNCRLFFRFLYVTDASVRAEWRVYRPTMDATKCPSQESFELQLNDPKVTAKKEGDMHSAEAFIIWGLLSKTDQDQWKARFGDWKTTQAAGAVPAALGADVGTAYAGAAPVVTATALDVNNILDSSVGLPF